MPSRVPILLLAILETLVQWRSQHPSTAKFDKLIEILNNRQLADLTESLTRARKQICDSDQDKPVVKTDPRFPDLQNFRINKSRHAIANVICENQAALDMWSAVKDTMVKVVTDNMKVDKHLCADEPHEAVGWTMDAWICTESVNANFVGLLGILADHNLGVKDELKDKVAEFRKMEPDDAGEGLEDDGAVEEGAALPVDRFRCPICQGMTVDRFIVTCGHSACSICIGLLPPSPISDRFACHVCRAEFQQGDIRPLYFV